MPHSPDYASMWEPLKRWAEYEPEAASKEADDTSEVTLSRYYSQGQSGAMARVLAQMQRLEEEGASR